jgi:dGTPase
MADEIAQRHHDIEDAIFANLLEVDEIIRIIEEKFSFSFDTQVKKNFDVLKNLKNKELRISYLSSFVVDFLVVELINNTIKNLKRIFTEYSFSTSNDFMLKKETIYDNEKILDIVNYNDSFSSVEKEFHDYLKSKILESYVAQKMDGKAEYIIKKIFEAFNQNPQQLPDRTILYFFENYKKDNYLNKDVINIGQLRIELRTSFNTNADPKLKCALLRTICDYITGMTDNFAYNQYELLYGSTRIYQ